MNHLARPGALGLTYNNHLVAAAVVVVVVVVKDAFELIRQ